MAMKPRRKPVKMRGGGMAKKPMKMRGGGMAKKPTMMRGGGMAKKPDMMMKDGGKAMSVAQIRKAAKAKGFKIVKMA